MNKFKNLFQFVSVFLIFDKKSKIEKGLKYKLEYMKLSRLQGDFIAFFGTGNLENDKWDCRFQNEKMIWGKNIKDLFFEMERLYKRIPFGIKPEWCTKRQMRKYKKMINQFIKK